MQRKRKDLQHHDRQLEFLRAGLQGGKLFDKEYLTMWGQNSSGGMDQTKQSKAALREMPKSCRVAPTESSGALNT